MRSRGISFSIHPQSMTIMNEKRIIIAARVLSVVFTPFYLPFMGMLVLFLFSNMSIYPFFGKLFIITMVYLFTILLPTLLIRIYQHYHGWTPIELGTKERRIVPYIISIVCYFTCFYMMKRLHIPHFMCSILIAALFIQIACALINVRWKISTHTAAIGGVAGAIMAFANIFIFNPSWWLSLVMILGGMVGTSRMILRQHTLSQVVVGFVVGVFFAYFSILFM